jgi:hypothetical protein
MTGRYRACRRRRGTGAKGFQDSLAWPASLPMRLCVGARAIGSSADSPGRIIITGLCTSRIATLREQPNTPVPSNRVFPFDNSCAAWYSRDRRRQDKPRHLPSINIIAGVATAPIRRESWRDGFLAVEEDLLSGTVRSHWLCRTHLPISKSYLRRLSP